MARRKHSLEPNTHKLFDRCAMVQLYMHYICPSEQNDAKSKAPELLTRKSTRLATQHKLFPHFQTLKGVVVMVGSLVTAACTTYAKITT